MATTSPGLRQHIAMALVEKASALRHLGHFDEAVAA
jgi:hypothetical protein